MIEINNLSKNYGDLKAVNKISLKINKTEIFGFLGPNGSGKTTLMNMITNQINPTSGSAMINGNDVVSYKDLYNKIGIVFELPNLYMKQTIKNNLVLFSKIYNLPYSRVEEVMELLQLTERKSDKIDSLSKGWKQRVLIARALLHSPELLILDEPTSGLDPNTTSLLHGIIKKLNDDGVTILITTHNMNEADILCNRVAIIDSGEIKEIGEPCELKIKYQSNKLELKYFDNNEVFVKNCDNNLVTQKEIVDLLEADKLISVKKSDFSLGDVFYKVTGGELS